MAKMTSAQYEAYFDQQADVYKKQHAARQAGAERIGQDLLNPFRQAGSQDAGVQYFSHLK